MHSMLVGICTHLGCLNSSATTGWKNWCSIGIYLFFLWTLWFDFIEWLLGIIFSLKVKIYITMNALIFASNSKVYIFVFNFMMLLMLPNLNFNLCYIIKLLFCTWLCHHSSVVACNSTLNQNKTGRPCQCASLLCLC